MKIHAAADQSGYLLCREAEDAKRLCLHCSKNAVSGNGHYGWKTLYGWLFQCDGSLDTLEANDATIWVEVAPDDVRSFDAATFRKLWDEFRRSRAGKEGTDGRKP
ncbi:MAG: hypothetical protein LBS19_03140 [Clostridiales bacterium]|jgi:hypothetical protein|nr:hypothetical protein [Clostridiales bacterium]